MSSDYIVLSEDEFGPYDECGIIGAITNSEKELARDIYYGLFALQHRGQESAGIAVQYNESSIAYYKNMGLVSEVFSGEELELLPKTLAGIGHVRYSTTGSSNVINAQPVVFYGRHGRMAVAHNGNIANAGVIKDKMLKAGHIFQSSVDSEVIAALINYYGADNIVSGISKACEELVGAYALVLISENKLYAARDPQGLKPLVLGKRGDDYFFASESCGLDAMDATMIRDVLPGEIVMIDINGNVASSFMPKIRRRSCIFEYVYLARSDSVIDGVGVYEARYECGKQLAKLHKIDADIVAGVPDSALVSARGYSDVSGIPYVDALGKNRYVGRTFIQPTQTMRESAVKIKLSAFRNNIVDKRLILIEDSIVRGTTCKKIIRLLRQSGAREIHMLVASPIVKFPCYFGVDMDTREQLIGAFKSEEEICKEIGADSLHYIPLSNLTSACKGTGETYCKGCFDGKYPLDVEQYYCRKESLE
ncbi:MAG: amidophosphoribosyltransferase [Christensenellaceae bacterium]|jgi:amidophosphoribosyltransferase|nr:amidophosphoribosyltransferase [Christensenellaceae bacterium]